MPTTAGLMVSLAILLALSPSTSLSSSSTRGGYHTPGLRQIITRNATAVQLFDGRIMDIVEEQTCSAALVRLTCRSLTAFVYVIEAKYQPNRTSACLWDRKSWCRYKSLFATIRLLQMRRDYIIGRYTGDEAEEDPYDFRKTLNRRCSGHHHCRYRVMSDHPEALFWRPANIRIKYACIPEASVYKYCNQEIKVPEGVGGFLKSPGYPLYYLGGITCGWTFRSRPGQRIVLTFHDLSIRDHERDGSCLDVVRVWDDGETLLETCGSAAGIKIVSNTDSLTLHLIASARLYSARGFLLQYQVFGCSEVTPPPGSYVSNSNDTTQTKTLLCRTGTVFPDTGQRRRTIHCKDGHWLESIPDLPGCVAASSAIIGERSKVDADNRLAGLSDASGGIGAGILEQNGSIHERIPNTQDVLTKATNYSIMDQTQTAMAKDGNFVVDIILPMLLIAMLFIGNAVIVYIIFQYRKRKTPDEFRNEELVLTNDAHQQLQQPNGDSSRV